MILLLMLVKRLFVAQDFSTCLTNEHTTEMIVSYVGILFFFRGKSLWTMTALNETQGYFQFGSFFGDEMHSLTFSTVGGHFTYYRFLSVFFFLSFCLFICLLESYFALFLCFFFFISSVLIERSFG